MVFLRSLRTVITAGIVAGRDDLFRGSRRHHHAGHRGVFRQVKQSAKRQYECLILQYSKSTKSLDADQGFLFELRESLSATFFKEAAEMTDIFKTQRKRHLFHRVVRIDGESFGFEDHTLVDMIACRKADRKSVV